MDNCLTKNNLKFDNAVRSTFRPISGKRRLKKLGIHILGGLCSIAVVVRALVLESNGPNFNSYFAADMLASLWQFINLSEAP